ncbi:hypothetical protein [Cohnella cellulosilytica]|uniref:LPXTG cell wall anchor domain-containing protein n=1 Tax=Cohnella cellulosilytica TaxID=986710 RepID=A0ABW2F3H9_9BACL
MGQWTPEQYEETYQAYLELQSKPNKSDKSVAESPVTAAYKTINDGAGAAALSVTAARQTFSPFRTSLIVGGAGAAVLLIFLILKRKRQY